MIRCSQRLLEPLALLMPECQQHQYSVPVGGVQHFFGTREVRVPSKPLCAGGLSGAAVAPGRRSLSGAVAQRWRSLGVAVAPGWRLLWGGRWRGGGGCSGWAVAQRWRSLWGGGRSPIHPRTVGDNPVYTGVIYQATIRLRVTGARIRETASSFGPLGPPLPPLLASGRPLRSFGSHHGPASGQARASSAPRPGRADGRGSSRWGSR